MCSINQLPLLGTSFITSSHKLLYPTTGFYPAEDFIRLHGFGKAGQYALLSVTDTGTGEDKDNTQLCILDMIMPKKNGRDAYDEIKKINPSIKALFASGYTADIIARSPTAIENWKLQISN